MNFSRFFNYFISIFLTTHLVTNARPSSSANSNFNNGQPIFFEVKNIPSSSLSSFNKIIIDKYNRVLFTNGNSVFIFDGVRYQQIDIPGNPIISIDENDRILIGGRNYLALLTYDKTGRFNIKQLIDTLSNYGINQITGAEFGKDDKVYFTNRTILWKFEEQVVKLDSSAQPIRIFKTSNGIVCLSAERGFYKIAGNKMVPISLIKNTKPADILNVIEIQKKSIAITRNYPWVFTFNKEDPNKYDFSKLKLSPNEKILSVITAGSCIFLSLEKGGLIMLNSIGELISHIENFGSFSTERVCDINTSDGLNFFAITTTQIWRFINPTLTNIFDYRSGLRGKVNSINLQNGKIIIATSTGLYKSQISDKKREFRQISAKVFENLIESNNQIYATSENNFWQISDSSPIGYFSNLKQYEKVCFIDSRKPKIALLGNHKIFLSSLEKNSPLKELKLPINTDIENIYSIDSLLLVKTLESKFYSINLNKDEFVVDECQLFHYRKDDFSYNILINNNVYYISNDRIIRSIRSSKSYEESDESYIIGKTRNNEPIINLNSGLHPDYQTLVIRKKGNKNDDLKLLAAIPISQQIYSVFTDFDSTFWIGTSEGLIYVSPDYLLKSKNRKPPQIALYSFSSTHNKKTLKFGNSFFTLPNGINTEFKIEHGGRIDISLCGLGSIDWNNLTYSVQLIGEQETWTNWSTINNYSYSELKPGKYVFKAIARDLSGLESSELSFAFTLKPNFFQTDFALSLFVILAGLSVYAFFRWRNYSYALEKFKLESIINKRTDELVREKEKTDNLLARVLPRDTANELKETGKVSTQKFKVVTVLFSDIQGFTKITDDLNPESLIDQLDKFFLYFDSVVEKYKIEKIKTIGDAYMCAGGIPQKNRTNPVEVVLAALEMMFFMKEINKQHNPGQDIWDLRIGIDTGPVIAGVVGRNKLSYDIWGTTVNTASRMESSGEVGKINISGNTFILVQEYFLCTYRGRMPIKNKGDIEMYFVNAIKPSLQDNLESIRPNHDFEIHLQILRLGDLEELILEKLDKGLPKNLYYHNLKHTVDVYTEVELIGRAEKVTNEEMLILRTAALFHDAGHMIDYDTHEEMGVKLAREILPEYQYSEQQIQAISELIMVTKLPPRPKNLLEAIICDSDLDYLGRTDFIPVSNMLYKELHEHGKIGSIHEWNQLQIKFIEKHQYFTNTARKLRNVNKNSQLENIKNWIEKNKL